MTAADLRMWLARRGLSHEAAARALGLSVAGLRKQLYGARPVGAQTALIAALLDQQAPAPRRS